MKLPLLLLLLSAAYGLESYLCTIQGSQGFSHLSDDICFYGVASSSACPNGIPVGECKATVATTLPEGMDGLVLGPEKWWPSEEDADDYQIRLKGPGLLLSGCSFDFLAAQRSAQQPMNISVHFICEDRSADSKRPPQSKFSPVVSIPLAIMFALIVSLSFGSMMYDLIRTKKNNQTVVSLDVVIENRADTGNDGVN